RNPVYSALFLILTLLCLAGLFLLLRAHFLAVIQIIVYAGAIMVLFLFVIMLLDIRRAEATLTRVRLQKTLGSILVALALLLIVKTTWVLGSGAVGEMAMGKDSSAIPDFGTAPALGRALFSSYVLPLELAAVLLFVALIGAIVLSKHRE
ncbi:MAG: NADH-quinone oxidoreductase subunit J family protein, partial [Candidatus Entotheonellia bacterium]